MCKMKQRFDIPGTLDGLNEYTDACRSNAHSGARMKKANEESVYWAIKSAHLKPMKPPVVIRILWVEGLRPGKRNFRPRDRDNIQSSVKFILDALRAPTKREAMVGAFRTGIIPDDDYASVVRITHAHRLNRTHPHILVELEEVDAE